MRKIVILLSLTILCTIACLAGQIPSLRCLVIKNLVQQALKNNQSITEVLQQYSPNQVKYLFEQSSIYSTDDFLTIAELLLLTKNDSTLALFLSKLYQNIATSDLHLERFKKLVPQELQNRNILEIFIKTPSNAQGIDRFLIQYCDANKATVEKYNEYYGTIILDPVNMLKDERFNFVMRQFTQLQGTTLLNVINIPYRSFNTLLSEEKELLKILVYLDEEFLIFNHAYSQDDQTLLDLINSIKENDPEFLKAVQSF